jgi:hypothetical protein
MIGVPSGMRVWIATGHTDMRRGMNSLALLVQEALKRDPHGGDLYVFRGKNGKLIKILWHDGIGMSLYAKRLETSEPKKPMVGSLCDCCAHAASGHAAAAPPSSVMKSRRFIFGLTRSPRRPWRGAKAEQRDRALWPPGHRARSARRHDLQGLRRSVRRIAASSEEKIV